ncbi:HD domain-containing protein [Eubacterium xylanophilum]|uniref:HD domain-containing protein n=1 Tax=Eubacterium xylanophilum TaxID=39497 RepID=UPI0004ADC167|nr:HD domain-containing protein [Eubacterium xylanophilum]
MTSRDKKIFKNVLREIVEHPNSRFLETKEYIQHGRVSVFRHSVNVAYNSLKLARKLKIKVNERELIRGALLHDYFLYDWHDGKPERRLHGFFHPGIAMKNAEKHFGLSKKEKDIIKHHMFPLTFPWPRSKEALLVCFVDKALSIKETLNR